LQLEYNTKIDKLVQKTTTMELKFEYTNTYEVLQRVINKKDLQLQEKELLVQEKEREKDLILREKEKDFAIIVHSIEKLLEKGFPVREIADCLGLSVAEIEKIIEKYKIKM